ncbi:hypothetical protein KKA14_20335 [bacterium]|nr:hypothetical protein [bacterium]
MYDRLIDSWDEDQVLGLHADIVSMFMKSETELGVEAAVEYALFLKHRGLDSQNYPIYLNLLLHKNEQVIDALLGDGKILQQFKDLQKTHYLIHTCFELLKRFVPGKVYDKTLTTLLGLLYLNFHNAAVAYKLYPLMFDELNCIARYLDKSRPQSDKINRIILDILADIGELSSKDTKDHMIDRIGAHANKIRSAFLDNSSNLEEALPASMISG